MTAFNSALSAVEARPHDAAPEEPLARVAPSPPAPEGRRRKSADKATAPSAVFIRVNPEGLAAIQALADELDTFVQDLGVEALNDLLAKHGCAPVVRRPGGR